MANESIDKFMAELPRIPPCWTCKHKNRSGPTCTAFPDDIPDEILTGRHQHRESYPGDNGIQFEPEE